MNKDGSTKEFDANWKNRKETLYNHWIRGDVENQIQLAFRSHWKLFQELLKDNSGKKCLEVGCGRGSISSYFADAGYDCTLLDYSQSVLDTAKKVFENNGHKAKFVCGDARNLPFQDGQFDVVVSIGLLEHFEDIQTIIDQQYRILNKGGVFLGYIVPENKENIQKYFNFINKILNYIYRLFKGNRKELQKVDIYRSDDDSKVYVDCINKHKIKDLFVSGVYPLPMISHSPEFPFSLLPKPLEKLLTTVFKSVLIFRKLIFKRNPWLCDEKLGQAFLVAFKKA